jgi:3-oxoacyl-(acyl-carrier-protein) synthase/NAD(P)-dependent dehydrogenase (short-subunit alcohol dehydrogenase family)
LRDSGDAPAVRSLRRAEELAPYPSLRAVVADVVGPSARALLLDAACASSLYTLALGSQRLQEREADLVLAGGVFAPGPGNSCLFAQFRGLSATGSRPFDASADGVIFGDGAAVVALKRLEDAIRDGDDIRAVVRGAGLSSDGKSSSANGPRSEGQVLAMERCYRASGIDPRSVQYVEAHGTATPAGDATELKSLARFFGERAGSQLRIGSVKALIGHVGWAAGAASILKLCQALRHGLLPRQHQFERPQRELAGLASIAVQVAEQPWPANGAAPRRAATNGFGFGGTNAHVVLEQYAAAYHAALVQSAPAPSRALDELSVVACEGLFDERGLGGVPLPATLRLLPDIAEDMDVTQRLGLVMADRVSKQMGAAFAALKPDTAIVLALEGKTPRGREAGLRVLSASLARALRRSGDERSAARTAEVVSRGTRSSGPYTLQGMMPNVTPGRVANVFDTKGPNFLVDGGQGSVYDALATARQLLRSGSELVLAGGFEGMADQAPRGAALLALMDPAKAAAARIPELCRLRVSREPGAAVADPRGLRALVAAVAAAKESHTSSVALGAAGSAHVAPVRSESPQPESAASAAAYYAPALVARPLPDSSREQWSDKRVLFLAPDAALAHQIEDAARGRCGELRVLVPPAGLSEESAQVELSFLDRWQPERVITIARLRSDAPEQEVVREASSSRALLELQFLVARKLYARLERGETALLSLCLDAQAAEGTLHPATGLYAGFAKSVAREVGPSRVRAVATSGRELLPALDLAARELAHPVDTPTEAFWSDGARKVRLLVPSTETSRGASRLDARSVVLATGGARGVTALLVEALLRRHACTVVVLGRSNPASVPERVLAAREDELDELEKRFYADALAKDPAQRLPELRKQFERQRAANELRRTLQRFAQLGGKVVYRSADITRAESVDAAIAEVVRDFGRLDLVLHGAGLQSSKKLDRRRLPELRDNLDVKLTGLRNLYDACARRLPGPVPFHVLTSAFSFFGNDGQADYGAANETLDRLCAFVSARRGEVCWSSIGWLAWDGIGMTAASEYKVLRGHRQLHRLGAAEGQRLFLDVLGGQPVHPINVQLSEHERAFYGIQIAAPRSSAVSEVRIDAASPWLADHRVRNGPTLPGAFALDRMLGAAQAAGRPEGGLEISGGRFRRFLRLKPGATHTLRAQVERQGESAQVRLVGDLVHHSGIVLDRDVLYAEACFSFGSTRPLQPLVRAPGAGAQPATDPYCAPGADVELRSRFDCLRQIRIGSESRSAEVVLPAEVRAGAGEHLPALLLDAAWRLGAIHAEGASNVVYAALDFERISFSADALALARGQGPLRVSMRALRPRVEGETVRCERVEVADERGQILLVVENGRGRRLEQAAVARAS